jgi:hypothetical protein
VALLWVHRALGASLATLTCVRVFAAAALIGCLVFVWQPAGLIQGVAALAVVGLSDLAILVVMRELGAQDWQMVQRVLGRR